MLDQTDALWLGPYAVDPAEEIENIFEGLDEIVPELSGDETFTVHDFDGPGAPVAYVDDFDPSIDTLYIQCRPVFDAQAGGTVLPELDVLYDAQAGLTRITLDGVEVATLEGDAGITVADIAVTPLT